MNSKGGKDTPYKQPTLRESLPRRDSPLRGKSFAGAAEGQGAGVEARAGDLESRLLQIKEQANFAQAQHSVRDGVVLQVFVRHQGYDAHGVLLPDDGSTLPGAKKQKAAGASSRGAHRNDHNLNSLDDPGIGESSDEEETIDYDDDAEEPVAQVKTHKFTVDLVARYPDESDDLLLHWGMSRKHAGAWGTPDASFLPPQSTSWPDGLAVQTTFARDQQNQSIRTITIVLKWVEGVDQPVTSMSYVLTERNKNCWHRPGGTDQSIVFCPGMEPEPTGDADGKWPGAPSGKIGYVVGEILNCEVKASSWTLMHRYHRCKDLLRGGNMDVANRDHVAYLYIWLRYSFSRQLSWQRHYNTRPKELQNAQVQLTDELCEQYKAASRSQDAVSADDDMNERFLSSPDILRCMFGFIGKGAGNGQQVRDEILHIMHRNKISERAGHFYEQWHQKLHNNTTPDDIPICEALLAYLKSGGDMSKYWQVLSKSGITRERLASYERKITEEPWYKPEAIADFEGYLGILKQMHSSDDMNLLIAEARRHVGADTHRLMNDVQANYKDQDALRQMGRALALRSNLCDHHLDQNNTGKLKDILFLDLCLEAYVRLLTERIMHIDIGFEAYVQEVALILNNLCLSYQWHELKYCRDDWQRLLQPMAKELHEDNARKAKSVIDRVKQALGEVNDGIMAAMQTKAEMMGKAFGVDEFAMKLFAEEVLRGTLFFSLSMILKKIDPHVRNCAHLGDWLIISQGRSHGSRGYCERVKVLADVMHNVYDRRTVLLVDKITGEEEVPANVQAIIILNSSDYPDVLAHVSVRARNLKVMLVVLFDDAACKELIDQEGRHLIFSIEGSHVKYQEQNPNLPLARRASSHLILQSAIDEAARLEPPPMFSRSFLRMNEFSPDHMGAKSNNLKILQGKLPAGAKVPESATIPFQMPEYSLRLEPGINSQLQGLIDSVATIKSVRKMNKILYKCKQLVESLPFHESDQHHQYLRAQLVSFGIPASEFQQAWATIKRVWASKYNERAFLATKKLGVSINQIFMAVLVQRVVPSEYAYVIHTTNPTNSNDQEVYVESCLGLGEALVSDMPGQALSFSYDKVSKRTRVNNYPNKSLGLRAEGFIFRSDSNSEDLPGFAGAGLFDSYTMHKEDRFRISYNQERLIVNEQFRQQFMLKIGAIGHHIEQLYDDEPQDIEGAYYNGEYYVVQTRPQV